MSCDGVTRASQTSSLPKILLNCFDILSVFRRSHPDSTLHGCSKRTSDYFVGFARSHVTLTNNNFDVSILTQRGIEG